MTGLRARILVAGLLLGSVAAGFLVSNSPVNGRFVYEAIPSSRRPVDILVDTEAVPGVANPIGVAQDLMNQWNLIPEADDVFGTASAGGPYNGTTVGDTFGKFTNTQYEIAFDDTGEILMNFGISPSVLGITLKSVTTDDGNLLDFLVVVNTTAGALVAPGTGATAEELFRSTLLHELGHATGLGHTPTGFVNTTTFGILPATPAQMPTMYAFRLPTRPQEGGTLQGDDAVGLTQIYPGDTSGLGSISGHVRALSGAPVNEIAVRAVGPQGGNVQHIGTLTNADGRDDGAFTIPDLPPGRYALVIEAVNGRGSIGPSALAGGTDSLGGNPFTLASDEEWQVGDTYDPSVDAPGVVSLVTVRAGRDTGSIEFVLNGVPLTSGPAEAGSLGSGDSQIGDAAGGFHYVDYRIFQGTNGDDVTITVNSTGLLVPQVQLLRPSDLALEASDLPTFGTTAGLSLTLDQTGPWILAVSARATTGNTGGTGNYTLGLQGATGTLAAPITTTPLAVARGPADPAAQQFASPVCRLPLLQLRLTAPSHEELWLDGLTVRASGSGDDAADVAMVSLVHDRNGDGSPSGDPVLATGVYLADNGTLAFDNLDVVFEPGTVNDLLVVYDVTVTSVSSTTQAGFAWPWYLLGLLLAPLAWLRTRRRVALAAAVLALALVPLACGGGGGSGCNAPFDPAGAAVAFRVTVDAGGLDVTTSTQDPANPPVLPTAAITSNSLTVSN